jgi:tetratricopeptide (TPR) repeat protein
MKVLTQISGVVRRLLPTRTLYAPVAVVLLFASQPSFAFTFVPSSDEWATWPAYCRARYATIDYLVQGTDFANQVSAPEIAHWSAVVGPVFQHVHHYCAGLVEYQHALTDNNRQDRQFHLGEALGDTKYIFDRMEMTDPLAPDVAALLAQIQIELGHPDIAEQVLDRVMSAQPTADRPYLVMSTLKRKGKNPQEAIDVLEQGNKLTSYKSAEINYALGLLYFDRHDYAAARECATRAYALGYPLPGLRNKLKRVDE